MVPSVGPWTAVVDQVVYKASAGQALALVVVLLAVRSILLSHWVAVVALCWLRLLPLVARRVVAAVQRQLPLVAQDLVSVTLWLRYAKGVPICALGCAGRMVSLHRARLRICRSMLHPVLE